MEMAFLIISKRFELLHMEAKNVTDERKPAATTSDKTAFCGKAVVQLAWDQIKERFEMIKTVLKSDMTGVGEDFGVINDMLETLINRFISNRVSLHPQLPQLSSSSCGIERCSVCKPKTSVVETGKLGPNFYDNLDSYLPDKFNEDPLFKDDAEAEKLFLCWFRRYLVKHDRQYIRTSCLYA